MATERAVGERSGVHLLRERGPDRQRVTFAELFFDLVYVFAVTQLSRSLRDHLDVRGALQTVLLFLVIWGVWIDTAWVTNWFDPDRRPVRTMLLGIMLVSLIMSASLPRAFGDGGRTFALAYTAIQIGRTAWVIANARADPVVRRNFQRILAWSGVSGVFWVAGGFAADGAREGLWVLAALIDFAAPSLGFVTPGLGRSTPADWAIAGEHLAERCQLFVIIALGESILATGAAVTELPSSAATLAAFATAFLGAAAFWWLYFDRAAEAGSGVIERAPDPGRLGRSAYTYAHLPIIAGIIVSAVGDEMVIAHPGGRTNAATALVVLGGPALFLLGHALFKWLIFGGIALNRLLGIVALAALVPASAVVPPLALALTATLVVLAVAASDYVLRRRFPWDLAAPRRAPRPAPLPNEGERPNPDGQPVED